MGGLWAPSLCPHLLSHPMSRPYRAWVNQPSTLQPLHSHHGTRVIAYDGPDVTTIYFLSGDVISVVCPKSALSMGWPAHLS